MGLQVAHRRPPFHPFNPHPRHNSIASPQVHGLGCLYMSLVLVVNSMKRNIALSMRSACASNAIGA
eukprot:752247-Amphidinium_carterae.1